MKKLLTITLIVSTVVCLKAQPETIRKDKALIVSFGSCNKQYKPQPLWNDILQHNPDIFLFLGDNIYGDTDNMQVLQDKYQQQNENENYARLKNQVAVWGVWDDHDYGKNDAGAEYAYKKESEQLFWDFMNVPDHHQLRKREGVYSAFEASIDGQAIKFIFLDARYHRDELTKTRKGYKQNKKGTILGEEQWNWLEKEIADPSKIYVLASGIQFIAKDHKYEKWANFPKERERLFKLIESTAPKGVLFLSGDRHIAEISSIWRKELPYPLVDITSSGLTHTWNGAAEEYNEYRDGELIAELNYGLLRITKENNEIIISAEIRGNKQKLYLKKELSF